MLLATHSIVGAFVGSEVGYPPLAFLLGMLSHFCLDAIPHADGPDDKKGQKESDPVSAAQYAIVALDLLLAIFAFYYISKGGQLSTAAIWGAIGAILPDLIDNVPFWYGIRRIQGFKQFHTLHMKIQSIKTPMWLGLTTQYIIAIVFFYLLMR